MKATPTAKVFEQIRRRTEAREAAGDAAGLWSLYMAAIEGAGRAEAAYERVVRAQAEKQAAVENEKQEARAEKQNARVIRQLEKNERSAIYQAVRQAGGIRTREDLREEYRGIPNVYKSKDGMAGDELAEHLATHHPEFGITSERDLIDFFTNRAAADRRAA